ncbi:hypothetical protein C8R43DRAFT_1117398 [Mycena crocata]|nr:hypothetical protein C8R43DRAFT_1117398 [Mycena crocata]
MPPSTPTLDLLCHDDATRTKAYRLLLLARSLTTPGSGFDLGGISSGLDAICTYLASCNVTIEAAQAASCQSLGKFKQLRNTVAAALKAHRAAHRAHKHSLFHPRNPPTASPPVSRANHHLPTTPSLPFREPPHPHTKTVRPKQCRFRPVFHDQQQWEACDPRVAIQAAASMERHQCLIKLYGRPFQAYPEETILYS